MSIESIRLKIEQALADGKLSHLESEAIKAAIYADNVVSPEEAELFRKLQEKIWQGEVQIDND
jgi:hypothetical protein